jgi:hypothetical protein
MRAELRSTHLYHYKEYRVSDLTRRYMGKGKLDQKNFGVGLRAQRIGALTKRPHFGRVHRELGAPGAVWRPRTDRVALEIVKVKTPFLALISHFIHLQQYVKPLYMNSAASYPAYQLFSLR